MAADSANEVLGIAVAVAAQLELIRAVALVGSHAAGRARLGSGPRRLPSGLEVELNFAAVSWACAEPLDAGTYRVVLDGMLPLYDPDRLLVALADAVAQAQQGSGAGPGYGAL